MPSKGRKGRGGRGARALNINQPAASPRITFPGELADTSARAPLPPWLENPPGDSGVTAAGVPVSGKGAVYQYDTKLVFGALPAATDPYFLGASAVDPLPGQLYSSFAKAETPLIDFRQDLESPQGNPTATRYNPHRIMAGIQFDAFFNFSGFQTLVTTGLISTPLTVVVVYFSHPSQYDRVEAVGRPIDITTDFYAASLASGRIALRFPVTGPVRYWKVGIGIYQPLTNGPTIEPSFYAIGEH